MPGAFALALSFDAGDARARRPDARDLRSFLNLCLPGCAAPVYVSLRSEGKQATKPEVPR